jgi:hypothetical protein
MGVIGLFAGLLGYVILKEPVRGQMKEKIDKSI